jgi:hypothetical protein
MQAGSDAPSTSSLNPAAAEFVPAAHRAVCAAATSFLSAHMWPLYQGIGAVCNGEDDDFPRIRNPQGRIWWNKSDYSIRMVVHIPFDTEPAACTIDKQKVVDCINRILTPYLDIDWVSLEYSGEHKRMSLSTRINCYDG